MTASARFAAVSASSVSGDPVASIEACNILRSCYAWLNLEGLEERTILYSRRPANVPQGQIGSGVVASPLRGESRIRQAWDLRPD